MRVLGVAGRHRRQGHARPAPTSWSTMHYDSDVDVPADANAVIVAPSIVGDRFVQLTPVFTGGQKLADGAVLDVDNTSVPLELDQIYSSLDQLTVALGPNGANKNGALTDLLETTAAELRRPGRGSSTRPSRTSASSAQTLDDNKEELFGSAAELEEFISTLADNDQTVREFNQSLAAVSTCWPASARSSPPRCATSPSAWQGLDVRQGQPRRRSAANITGLNRVAKVLVKQRDALDETLRTAPLALNNLALTYNPQAGTLDTNANIGELVNQISPTPRPAVRPGQPADTNGQLCNLIQAAAAQARGAVRAIGAGTGSSYGGSSTRRSVASWRWTDEAACDPRSRPAVLRPAARQRGALRLRLRRLRPAAARRHRRGRQPDHGHGAVPRRPRPGPQVHGQGQRRQRRPGHRRSSSTATPPR